MDSDLFETLDARLSSISRRQQEFHTSMESRQDAFAIVLSGLMDKV